MSLILWIICGLSVFVFQNPGDKEPVKKNQANPQLRLVRKELATRATKANIGITCQKCDGSGKLLRKIPVDKKGLFTKTVSDPCKTCKGLKLSVDAHFHQALSSYYGLLATLDLHTRRTIEPRPSIGTKLLRSVKTDIQAEAMTNYWNKNGSGKSGAFVVAVEGLIVFEHKDPQWAVMLAGPINRGGFDKPTIVLVFHDFIPPAAHARGGGVIPERLMVVAHTEQRGFYSKWIKKWMDDMRAQAAKSEVDNSNAKEKQLQSKYARDLIKQFDGTDQLLTVAAAKPIPTRWFKQFPHWKPEHLREKKPNGKK